MLRRILSGLVVVLWSAAPLLAQQGTAEVRGKVSDQQGGVLPGVTVVVRHQESGLFREAVTGADGSFLMSAMTPGVYEVAAELTGFKRYTQRDVRLEVGRTANVELKLEVGGLTESVTVSGETPLVDTTSQEIGGRISSQEFIDTPSFNRNFAAERDGSACYEDPTMREAGVDQARLADLDMCAQMLFDERRQALPPRHLPVASS